MTKVNTQSCNKFDPSMVFTNKNIFGGWPDIFQGIIFKSTMASDISNVMLKLVLLDNSWWKKIIFEEVMFCFEKEYVFSISSGVRELY